MHAAKLVSNETPQGQWRAGAGFCWRKHKGQGSRAGFIPYLEQDSLLKPMMPLCLDLTRSLDVLGLWRPTVRLLDSSSTWPAWSPVHCSGAFKVNCSIGATTLEGRLAGPSLPCSLAGHCQALWWAGAFWSCYCQAETSGENWEGARDRTLEIKRTQWVRKGTNWSFCGLAFLSCPLCSLACLWIPFSKYQCF